MYRLLTFMLLAAVAPLAEGQSVGFLVKDPEAELNLAPDLDRRVAICVLGETATAPSWSRFRYIVFDPGKSEMTVIDRIEGHHLQVVEKSVSGNRFVFAYYSTGANQNVVSVYVLVDRQLKKLAQQPSVGSNMHSITIEESVLVFKNIENDDRGERQTLTDRFDLLDAVKRGFRNGS